MKTTFTAAGMLFTTHLTPSRVERLERAGFPLREWAMSPDTLSGSVFGSRLFAFVMCLVEDQIPVEWPHLKACGAIASSVAQSVDAVIAGMAEWYQRVLLDQRQ